MARKRELADKLSSQGETQGARPGWRDAITGPRRDAEPEQEERAPREDEETRRPARRRRSRRGRDPLQRKTYLLTPEMVEHVAALAEAERVGINELVRFLLRASLEMVETGELEIPTQPARRQIVREE
ncbi:MAG: hypothetical protein ACOC9Z_02710 [Chloroflexota bacterium]